MNAKSETLDDFLNYLDTIKEKVAEETRGMNAKQVKQYFAGAARRLQEATGQKVRIRRRTRNVSAAKG